MYDLKHYSMEGDCGWLVIFRLFMSIFLKINFIVLFPCLIKYYNLMFIIIVFLLISDRPSVLFFSFVPAVLLYSLTPSYLRLFLYLITFLLFQCASVWETLVHESIFPIAILNGTSFFPTVQLDVLCKELKTRKSCSAYLI